MHFLNPDLLVEWFCKKHLSCVWPTDVFQMLAYTDTCNCPRVPWQTDNEGALPPWNFVFQGLIWCSLPKHKEVTCGFVNLVKGNVFPVWKLGGMFQQDNAATQILSTEESFSSLRRGYFSSRTLFWKSEQHEQREDRTARSNWDGMEHGEGSELPLGCDWNWLAANTQWALGLCQAVC